MLSVVYHGETNRSYVASVTFYGWVERRPSQKLPIPGIPRTAVRRLHARYAGRFQQSYLHVIQIVHTEADTLRTRANGDCATQSNVHRPIRSFPSRDNPITFQQNVRKKLNGVCNRCRKQSHVAARCHAPAPVYSSVNHTGAYESAPKNEEFQQVGGILLDDHAPTTCEKYARLIIIDIEVEGASRRLRALVDFRATNSFIGESCLVNISSIDMKKLPGNMTVRLADGFPCTTPKRVVSMSYDFDDFEAIDKFLVINMGGKFH
uniref:Putative polyprotein n=1 Tax=Albugo laibachii Nc14 TaxID=890382 RepID=F0WU44_9STRA|nr:putative polyprotein [Albugo laibachii Nc14]|eukprot:CCA24889.1 putative polyprotein [Albugo laibachii Nc14]